MLSLWLDFLHFCNLAREGWRTAVRAKGSTPFGEAVSILTFLAGFTCQYLLLMKTASPSIQRDWIALSLPALLSGFVIWIMITMFFIAHNDRKKHGPLKPINPEKQALQRKKTFDEFSQFLTALRMLGHSLNYWHPSFDNANTYADREQLVLAGLLPHPDSDHFVQTSQLEADFEKYKEAVRPLSLTGYPDLMELRWQFHGEMEALIEFRNLFERFATHPQIGRTREVPANRVANGNALREMAVQTYNKCFLYLQEWLADSSQ